MPVSSGGSASFAGRLREPPLGPAVFQAPRRPARRAQAADGVVGVGAERAAAVGHDLMIGRQLGEALLELFDRDRSGTLDVAGLELLGGADVDEDDVAATQPLDQLVATDRIDVVAKVVASGS